MNIQKRREAMLNLTTKNPRICADLLMAHFRMHPEFVISNIESKLIKRGQSGSESHALVKILDYLAVIFEHDNRSISEEAREITHRFLGVNNVCEPAISKAQQEDLDTRPRGQKLKWQVRIEDDIKNERKRC